MIECYKFDFFIFCQNKKFVQTFFFKLLVAKLLYFLEDQGIRNPVKENVISFMIQYSTGSQKFVPNWFIAKKWNFN